ncbi:ComF family protein [Candidatus Dojkabacteria bacterium]|nr:ComF family protein [Candidatus Dojkabacteria bacterium]
MIISWILNKLFPRICYGCGEVGTYLCEYCLSRKNICRRFQECHVCKKRTPGIELVHNKCRKKTYLDGVIISLKYDGFVERLIAEFKYEFVLDLKNLFVEFLVTATRNLFSFYVNKNELVITFVPLHSKRERWRGYNQSKELAKVFSKRTKLMLAELLIRNSFSRTQVGLKKKERKKNVKGVFSINSSSLHASQCRISSKIVLIIDDVMTTGATLEECAKVLKEGGVKKVYGLVIARG